MDSRTPDSSEDKDLTSSTQRRNSAVELMEDNLKNEAGNKTFEEQMQRAAVDRVGVMGDAIKGSERQVPPTKTTNTAKAIKQPKYCGIYLVPGINTEKRQYNAEDEHVKQPKYCGTYLVPGINTEKRQYNAEDEHKD